MRRRTVKGAVLHGPRDVRFEERETLNHQAHGDVIIIIKPTEM
jgi:hypothetical protein